MDGAEAAEAQHPPDASDTAVGDGVGDGHPEEEGLAGAQPDAAAEPADDGDVAPAAETKADTVNIDLPASAIARILKAKLPAGTMVSKEAKASAAKAASIFVLYLSSSANDICKASKRSTINANDVLRALGDIDMGDLAEACGEYFGAYKKQAGAKQARKVSAKGAAAPSGAAYGADAESPAKRHRTNGAESAGDDGEKQ